MKKCLIPLLILFTLLATSCLKNEFQVSMALDSAVNATYRVAYYTAGKSKGWFTESAITVQGGKGSLRGITRMPTIIYIYSGGSARPEIAIYAERGDDIEISGPASPAEWRVGGNDINEKLTRWRLANVESLRSHDPARINAAVASYVREHTDEPVSLILLMTSYDRRADEDGFRRLYFSLGEKALAPEWTGLFERADVLMTDPAPAQKIPARLRGLADSDSIGEIRLADAERTLFWVRRADDSDNPSYVSPLDSLRAFFRKADSSRRRLAVISFDCDTSALLRTARLDSLPPHPALWEPSAEASPSAKALRAPRTPYYVVATSSGSVLYRGDDIAKALKAMH